MRGVSLEGGGGMKIYKKPKYKVDVKKIPVQSERDLSGEELYKEILREKRRKAR